MPRKKTSRSARPSQSSPKALKASRRSKKKPDDKAANRHILVIGFSFVLCMALAVSTILYTMVSQKHLWSGNSALNSLIRDSVQYRTIAGVRGEILDRSNQPIARQTIAYTITANFDTRTEEEKKEDEQLRAYQRQNVLEQAKEDGRTSQVEAALKVADEQNVDDYIENPAQAAAAIKTVLGDMVDEDELLQLLEDGQANGKAQIELGTGTKRISKDEKEKLEAMNIPGLSFVETVKREYPITPFSSNMIGFAAYSDESGRITGKSGLEKAMESYLGGEDGLEQYRATKLNQELPGSKQVLQEASNGENVKLTIDSSLQQTIEDNLRQTMEQSKATAAWCLVMDPETGKILGWGSYPTFDQNTHLVIPSYTDKISESSLEPGSVIKPIYYAMAIDAGVYPYNEYYRAGEFHYVVDEYTGKITRVSADTPTEYPVIMDALGTDYGTLTYADGLAHSSNIALCELLSNYLTKDTVQRYLDAFELFEATDIPFLNEVTGVSNNNTATDYLSSGFGQASSMTILELCKAYTAIFNDGIMMKPYVVDSIIDPLTNETIQKFNPEPVGTPIKADTAHQTIDLMRHVMDDGMTGERFRIDGVDMALKTGTGEIYNEATGTYDKTNYTSTVLAAAPADDPKVLVCYGMQGPDYLSYSADPFKNIMSAALKAQNVNTGTDQSVTEPHQEWTTAQMPSLVSHSLDYATQSLSDKSVNTVVIGNGDTIVSQFPDPGTTINSNDNVLLLTNGPERKMPDMIGWTRKDITAFWQLTGIAISADGYGRVNWQSIEAQTPLQDDTVIEVKLE